MDKEQIHAELDRVRHDFRELLDTATVAELRKPTEGTKWNNEQLLFHMVFGYLLVRNLRFLLWGFSRLPDGVSRRFAALLNAGTRPFHVINYVGSLFGARVLGYPRMERLMDRVLNGLQASLRGESEPALDRGMHFPIGWDPYFRDYMTLRDVYHYPTQHYDHHRRQLTLASTRGGMTLRLCWSAIDRRSRPASDSVTPALVGSAPVIDPSPGASPDGVCGSSPVSARAAQRRSRSTFGFRDDRTCRESCAAIPPGHLTPTAPWAAASVEQGHGSSSPPPMKDRLIRAPANAHLRFSGC